MRSNFEADFIKVGDLVGFFDKGAKRYYVPAKLLYIKQNDNGNANQSSLKSTVPFDC